MLTLRSRTALCLATALLAAGCVEVELRRTIAPDLSGRQTLALRAPKGARAELFPGLFTGGTCSPAVLQPQGDTVLHSAEVTFADVGRFHHQVEFLSSSATAQPGDGGIVAYRELVTNGYFRNLDRAPSEEARKTVAAAMADAKSKLAGAKLTYTIQFPGPVAKSNADRVSGNEATWALTTAKLFAGRTLELTAEYRTGPAPAVAISAPPAGTVALATPAEPEPAAPSAPEPKPAEPAAAPPSEPKPASAIPVAAAPAKAPEPPAAEAPVTRPSSRLEDLLLAQANEEPGEAPAAEPKAEEPPAAEPKAEEPPAAEPKAEEPPKKPGPKVTVKERPKKPEPSEEMAPPPLPKKAPVDLADIAGDDAATAEVKKLFRDALVHLDYKRYDKAAEALQKAIAVRPDSVLISNLYEQVVAKFLDAAVDSGSAELKAQAEALQQIAYKGRIRQLRDPKRIQELIDALRKGFLPRTFAIEELTLAGDYAVPHLLKFMQDNSDPELRAYAGHILSRMRGVAVPAICEALKHNDPMIRQIVLLALEVIADPRSVPSLLWLIQEPNAHPLVVAGAKRALARISDDPALLQTPASAAFLDLAKDYYDANRKVVSPHVYEHLVWRYDPAIKTLVSEAVPQHMYPARMAEEMCRNALLADPQYEPAVPLLLCAYFVQQNLLESFFITTEGKAELSKEEQEEAELLKPLRERLAMAPAIAQAAGKKFAYAALQRAMRDGRADVAISCIQALRAVADSASLPLPPPPPDALQKGAAAKKEREPAKRRRIMIWYGPEEKEEPPPPPPVASPNSIPLDGTPLIDALSYPDRRVRYAAAEAIVAINPTHAIPDSAKVMSNLAQALSETAYHVALLFEEDEMRAEELRPLLREAGVMPVLVRSQTDAVTAARELPPKDLLILSGDLKRVDIVEAVAGLRRVYTLAAAPLIVVAAQADEAKLRERLSKENAVFLTRPLTAGAVRATIESVLKGAPEPKGKDASVRYASSAARTLASIDQATSIFRLDDALDALLETLCAAVQPDDVRIPCCDAVRNAANPRAVPYLAQVYADSKSSKALRLAVLRTLGACAAPALPEEMAKQTNDVLRHAVADPDPDFRRAAAFAFGLKGGASGNTVGIIDDLLGRTPRPAPEAPKPPEKAPEKAPEAPAEKQE